MKSPFALIWNILQGGTEIENPAYWLQLHNEEGVVYKIMSLFLMSTGLAIFKKLLVFNLPFWIFYF